MMKISALNKDFHPPRLIGFVLVSVAFAALAGCVGLKPYHPEKASYLRTVSLGDNSAHSFDLAIIEFDDQGQFWEIEQLQDTVNLIEQRNREAEYGVLTIVFVHGWKHNAEINREKGALASFLASLQEIARGQAEAGDSKPDRVVGVFLAWRGATTRVPVAEQFTFWDRRMAAERMNSQHMRETLFRLLKAAKSRPTSKSILVGHSFGGLIVGQAIAHTLTSLLLYNGEDGLPAIADLVVLINPARDGLAAFHFIDFLKRFNVAFELRNAQGVVTQNDRPMIVSITSEADTATRDAYPLGRSLATAGAWFRHDELHGQPSQRYLVNHTEGHIDYLVSHQAAMVEGQVVLKPIAAAYNDTPFWIIRVTKEICNSHNDLNNPNLGILLTDLYERNGTYDTGVRASITTQPPSTPKP